MIITSKFKDYYDPVTHTYGRDPKIRYDRLEVKNTKVEFKSISAPLSYFKYARLRNKYHKSRIVVGNRIYSIFSKIEPYLYGKPEWFLPEKNHEIVTIEPLFFKKEEEYNYYCENKDAIELCKLVGQPVFKIINSYYEEGGSKWKGGKYFFEIEKEIPQLCKIKNFARLYPANQIYQDISYALGNLMHTPPDDNPPIQVDDKIRFQKKGFDKTSFRGKVQK